MNAYRQNIMKLDIFTVGGDPFSPEFNLTRWLQDIPNNMVTVDCYANPLHTAVSLSQFPELLPSTTRKISSYIQSATQKYIDSNRKSLEYFEKCNSGSTRRCSKVISGINSYSTSDLHMYSADYLSFSEHGCPKTHNLIHLFQYGDWTTYWCTKLNQSSENNTLTYLFGGFFSKSRNNPVTGEYNCKKNFADIRVDYVDIMPHLSFCLSTDYELAKEHAMGFGGFFSCKTGNPYALAPDVNPLDVTPSSWPRDCPEGYSAHYMITWIDCDFYVCLESGVFSPPTTGPLNIKLPPFTTDLEHVENNPESDELRVKSSRGTTLIRDIDGKWKYHALPDKYCQADHTMASIKSTVTPENDSRELV